MTSSRLASLLASGLTLAALVAAPFVLGTFQRALLTEILIWVIFVIAFDLLYGYTGMLSFGQGAFFGLGSYALTLAILRAKMGLWPALLGGVVFATVVAAIVGFFAVRVRGAYFVIITVIFSLIFFFWTVNWSWLTGGDDGLTFDVPEFSMGWWTLSLYDPVTNYYFVLAFALLSYELCRRIVQSPFGKVLLGIRENEDRAFLLGYRVSRYKLMAFVIAGALSGLSGALYSMTFRYANAGLMQWSVSGSAVIWTLFGGSGTLIGPILGTGILVVFTDYVSAWWEHYKIVIGLLIILILWVAPNGVVGVIRERWLSKATPDHGR